jgi:hypothetical protein
MPYDATAELTRAVTKLVQMASAPREVLRNSQGMVTGVRILEPPEECRKRRRFNATPISSNCQTVPWKLRFQTIYDPVQMENAEQ